MKSFFGGGGSGSTLDKYKKKKLGLIAEALQEHEAKDLTTWFQQQVNQATSVEEVDDIVQQVMPKVEEKRSLDAYKQTKIEAMGLALKDTMVDLDACSAEYDQVVAASSEDEINRGVQQFMQKLDDVSQAAQQALVQEMQQAKPGTVVQRPVKKESRYGEANAMAKQAVLLEQYLDFEGAAELYCKAGRMLSTMFGSTASSAAPLQRVLSAKVGARPGGALPLHPITAPSRCTR